MGDGTDRHLLDLGCGHGRLAKHRRIACEAVTGRRIPYAENHVYDEPGPSRWKWDARPLWREELGVSSPLGIRLWNDSLDLACRMTVEGGHVVDQAPVAMRHLCCLLAFDSVVMSNGLDEAMSRYPPEQMEAVAKACDYFDLHGLGSLVRRLAASNRDYKLAQDLNIEYWERRGRRPGENLIEAAVDDKLRTSPHDFGIGPHDSL